MQMQLQLLKHACSLSSPRPLLIPGHGDGIGAWPFFFLALALAFAFALLPTRQRDPDFASTPAVLCDLRWLPTNPPSGPKSSPPLWPASLTTVFPLQFSSSAPPRLGGRQQSTARINTHTHTHTHKSAAERVDLGRLGSETPALATSIIRQNPARETSDHAEVGLGLGWRVQSPTREGQKWSEGHSDVVRMQRKRRFAGDPCHSQSLSARHRITASLWPNRSGRIIHCRPLDSCSLFDLLIFTVSHLRAHPATLQCLQSTSTRRLQVLGCK
ncbi:hypothetical protein V8C35DRAFT_105349 [Trichoderma chlorosporum]